MARGLNPAAVLTFDEPLEEDQSKRYSRALSEYAVGGKRSGAVAVIGGKGANLRPYGMSLVDAQFVANSEQTFDLAMALWRVPPTVVGMVGKPSTWGTGIAEFSRGLERFTLRPPVELLQEGYERHIVAHARGAEELQVRIPFESLLSASPKERAEVQRNRLMMGATSLERILEQNDEPPFGDDETRFTQLSLATEEDRRLKRLELAANAAARLIQAGVQEAEAFRVSGLDVLMAEPANLG